MCYGSADICDNFHLYILVCVSGIFGYTDVRMLIIVKFSSYVLIGQFVINTDTSITPSSF
jgi:hypothetical protein